MNKNKIIKIVTFLLVVIGLLIALFDQHIREIVVNPHKLKHYIERFKDFAPFIFIILYTARTFLIVFPAGVFSIASGALFGKTFGFEFAFVFSMIGAFLSASLAFWLGQNLMSGFVQKHLADRIKFLRESKENHFKLIFYLRLIMLMPFDAFGYASGAANVRYRDFILGTMLGIIPEFLGYTYLGYAGMRPEIPLYEKLLISIGFISLILIGHFGKVIFEKIKKRKEC